VTDTTEERQEQELGASLLTLLHGLTRAVVLYEINNNAVVRLIDELWGKIEASFKTGGDELRLQLLDEEFFINGRLIRVDAQLYERATELKASLNPYEIGEIRIQSNVQRTQIESMLRDLSTTLRGQDNKMRPDGYGAVGLGKAQGRSMASLRFEPDKLAVWAYASLLDVVDQLFLKHGEGESPSLLPIKRIAQLILDGMANHSGIYQMLAAVRDPQQPLDRTRLRVAIAIDAMGFGVFMSLPNTHLLSLALAGILGGLTDAKDPEETVRPLFHYSGLGDAAMALVLTVHDLRAARLGQKAGVPGRMLSVVEAYHELVAGGPSRDPQAPTDALAAMVNGQIDGVDASAARVFMAYKGKYPLGTAVRMTNGSIGVVISHGASPEGKDRPTVALIGPNGRLGQRIDLRTQRGGGIQETVSAKEAGIDLSRA
jgi:hypothetical protein